MAFCRYSILIFLVLGRQPPIQGVWGEPPRLMPGLSGASLPGDDENQYIYIYMYTY